jgi:hypothetical protein
MEERDDANMNSPQCKHCCCLQMRRVATEKKWSLACWRSLFLHRNTNTIHIIHLSFYIVKMSSRVGDSLMREKLFLEVCIAIGCIPLECTIFDCCISSLPFYTQKGFVASPLPLHSKVLISKISKYNLN